MIKSALSILILTIGTAGGLRVFAQQPNYAKNICYVEFIGVSDVYCLNYERIIRYNQTLKAGISLLPENWYNGGSSEKQLLTIPLSYQFLLGTSSHKLAVSGGLIALFILNKNAPTQFKLNPNIAIGYRYQPSKKGPFIGCLFYLSPPVFLTADRNDLLLYTGKNYLLSPALSLGWIF